MIDTCIYSGGQGAGAFSDTYEEFIATLVKSPVKLENTIVEVDSEYLFTDLLSRPLKYVGRQKAKLWFYLGEYEGKFHFKEINWIDENLIYISYGARFGNSHAFKNGSWYRMGAKNKAKLKKNENS